MSVQKKLLRGTMFTKSHSTLIAEAVLVMKRLSKQPHIDKIVIGEIAPLRVSKRRMKVVEIPAGARLVIRGTNSQQTFFIYSKQKKLLKKAIEEIWSYYF